MTENDHTDAAGASSDTTTDTPTVPVFYHVPEAAAERAVRRFRQYREADDEDLFDPSRESTLRDFVLDEIRQQPVTYVGGQPLAAWASEYADDIAPDEV
jgi:hypothetical protein